MGELDGKQRKDDAAAFETAEDLVPTTSDFDWTQAEWGPLYPSPEILAELGRVTIAAARVDRQLALVLLAIKYSPDFEMLLKKSSGDLCKALEVRLPELFEGDLLRWTLANLAEVRKRIEVRHAVAHSIWSPADRSEFVHVEVLAGLGSQEELDELLFQRGASAAWETLHPKANAPGPQTMDELQNARRGLERAGDWLESLRFTLASALFAGKPPGARRVLDPRSFPA